MTPPNNGAPFVSVRPMMRQPKPARCPLVSGLIGSTLLNLGKRLVKLGKFTHTSTIGN